MRRLLIAAALIAFAAGSTARAQSGGQPIRLIIQVPPGGSIDLVARLIAEKLKVSLGEPVVVESHAGAGGRIAVEEIKRSAPDGRSIYVGTSGPFSVLPNIYGNRLEYDPVKDFTPLGRLVRFDLGFASGPAVPAKTIAEGIAWARANPSLAAFGTPGPGTTSHFVGIMIAKETGVPFTHVPYRGGTPAINDLIGGHLTFLVDSFADMTEQHKAGKLRILAAAGAVRSQLAPDVPTLKESGINVVADVAIDAYGPANMPADVVKRTNAALTQAVNDPEVKNRLQTYGLFPAPSTPEQLAAFQIAETKMWATPIKESGFTGE